MTNDQSRTPPSGTARQRALAPIWEQFADTVLYIAANEPCQADMVFRELISSLDIRFRNQHPELPEGGIHETLVIQLHGVLGERLGHFIKLEEARDEDIAARWIIGAIQVFHELTQLSVAFERVTAETGDKTPERQFTFAGKSTFITISQVVQLLGGSRHRGVLTLETTEERIEIYFDNSSVVFFSPRQLARRVVVSEDDHFREIPHEMITRAEHHVAQTGKPIVVSLAEQRFLEESEIREMGYYFGSEVFYAFLQNPDEVSFRFSRIDELPPYVEKFKFNMPVTPLLLEANKQQDDWQSLRKVFPDPEAPIEPTEDSLQRVGSMQLDAHELRILTAINGETSPKELTKIVGLPLADVYRTLIRFTRDEVVKPHCPLDQFAELLLLGLIDTDAAAAAPAQAEPEEDPMEQDQSFEGALDFLNDPL